MRYNGIQCLRAIATFLVCWTHLKVAANLGASTFISSQAGSVGVDIFFVISGFVISMSAENLKFNWRTFITLRYIRIIPFYWLISLILAFLTFHRHNWDAHSVVNTLLFIPLFDFNSYYNVIHDFGWSISFEIWFYSLFALLLFFFRSNAAKMIVLILTSLCFLCTFAYHGSWFAPHFIFSPFTLEFAAGVLLYQFRKHLTLLTLPIAGLTLLLCAWLVFRNDSIGEYKLILANPVIGLQRALIWGGLGLSAVAITVVLDQKSLLRWPHFLVWLGDCSYSMYLIQPFALIAAHQYASHFAAPPLLVVSIFVLVAIPGGALLSKTVEMPLIRWIKSKIKLQPKLATAA